MSSDEKPKYFKVVNDFKFNVPYSVFIYILFDIKTCEMPEDFNPIYKWILLVDKANFANFTEKAKKSLKPGVDSDVTVVVFNGNFAILYQIYKIKKSDSDFGTEIY